MYIYMYMRYMYICIYVCIYVYMYICICVYVYMCICVYVYMCICVYVYCMYIYVYVYVYVYVYFPLDGWKAGSLEKVGRKRLLLLSITVSSERSCINLGAVAGVKGVVHVLPPIPLHSSSYTWVLLLGRTRRPVKDKEAKIL